MFEDDELVQRLVELRDTLREQYDLKPSLNEQLAKAVETEQYELAARLRDEITRRETKTALASNVGAHALACPRIRGGQFPDFANTRSVY